MPRLRSGPVSSHTGPVYADDQKDTYKQHATAFLANLAAQYSEAFQLTTSELERILLGARSRTPDSFSRDEGRVTSLQDAAARCSVQSLLNSG